MIEAYYHTINELLFLSLIILIGFISWEMAKWHVDALGDE